MPCLCSSPERKSTSNAPKWTRPDRMGGAIVACVARKSSTRVRPRGWPLSEPQASSFQLPAPSESFQPRASLHALLESLARAESGAPRAISEHALRAGQDEGQDVNDKNLR